MKRTKKGAAEPPPFGSLGPVGYRGYVALWPARTCPRGPEVQALWQAKPQQLATHVVPGAQSA
jgi:hypothetical protein